ncbi:DEAD/DEAH box helicase [Gordonia sp. GN26]
MTAQRALRAWQVEALGKWRAAGRRGVIEAVTGSGKTEVGVAAVAEALAEDRQVLIIVPSRDLLRQWYERFASTEFRARVGRRGDGFTDTFRRRDVLISTVHSSIDEASRDQPGAGALIVADEVHRYGADSFAKALSPAFELRLGLTATFERSDDGVEKVLTPYFGSTIVGCTYERGYRDGILAPVRVALVPVPFTPQERARYEQYDQVARQERNRLIVEYGCSPEPFGLFLRDAQVLAKDAFADESTRSARRYLKAFSDRKELLAGIEAKNDALATVATALRPTGKTVVFAETKAAAASAAEAMLRQGVPAAPYTSDLIRRDRVRLLEMFKNGSITALTAPKVLDEGIDVPEADVGIVLAASKSRRQMIQRMGRVIRPKADGRPAVFIIMFAENSSEDPKLGAHETFLNQLTDIADEVVRTEPEHVGLLLDSWLPSVNSAEADGAVVAYEAAQRATETVAESAAAAQERAELIRQHVYSTTSTGRPEAIDAVLASLVLLEPLDAQILILRFGLGGSDPIGTSEIAERLGMDVQEVNARSEAVLARLDMDQLRSVEDQPEGSVAVRGLAGLNDVAKPPVSSSEGLKNPGPRRQDLASKQRSSVVLNSAPEVPSHPYGVRQLTLPGRPESAVAQSKKEGRFPRIYIECEGGHMPGATLDPDKGTVRLNEKVEGRRDFDSPDEAARAVVTHYGFEDPEVIDGWQRWRLRDSGQPIASIRKSSRTQTTPKVPTPSVAAAANYERTLSGPVHIPRDEQVSKLRYLRELDSLKRVSEGDYHQAPYDLVTLLWGIARVRRGFPRRAHLSDVRNELRSCLSPFRPRKAAPKPADPWFALRHSRWWDLAEMPPGATAQDVARLDLEAGLSREVAGLIRSDDEFARKAVDRLVRLISVEIGEPNRARQLVSDLGLA